MLDFHVIWEEISLGIFQGIRVIITLAIFLLKVNLFSPTLPCIGVHNSQEC